MKKSVIAILVLVILLVIVLLVLQIPEEEEEFMYSPPNIPIPQNCSDESIIAVWDTIFNESADGIFINGSTAEEGKCNFYSAYKINGQELYLLYGIDIYFFFVDMQMVVGLQGEFTEELLDLIRNGSIMNTTEMDIENILNFALPREILDIDAANTEFITHFDVPPGNWTIEFEDNLTAFIFNETEISGFNVTMHGGGVMANFTLNQFAYIKMAADCFPSWQELNTSCTNNETQVIYYNDTNGCGNMSTYPGNETIPCDYDDNGIIGDNESINDTNLNVTIFINGSELNLSEDYSSTLTVKIMEGSTERVTFDYDFTNPLDLNSIAIEKQPPSSTYGYLVINGISEDKTIKVDKKFSDTSICILNQEVSSINDLTSDCTGPGENYLDCPETSGGLSCTIDGDILIVSGLYNSAAKEIEGSPPPPADDGDDDDPPPGGGDDGDDDSCTPSWACEMWSPSPCPDIEIQTTTCTDRNACNVTTDKPNETRTCTRGETPCTPNWNCTAWEPQKCPKSKNRTSTCTDINSCDTLEDKPSETSTCKYETLFTTRNIIMTVVAAIILLAIIILYIILGRMNVPKTKATSQKPKSKPIMRVTRRRTLPKYGLK